MDPISSLLERPKAYYNVDGVGELSMGFMTLSFALIFWLQTHTPGNSAWHKSVWFILMGAIAIIRFGAEAIKQRITYPRTGFVEYPKSGRRLNSIVAAAMAALFVFWLSVAVRSHWDLSAGLPFIGLPMAAGYAFGVARAVAWKWAVFGVMATGSLVIALLPANAMGHLANDSWAPGVVSGRASASCWLTLMFYGTALLISGGTSFWLYLRRTRRSGEAI